MLGPPLAHGLPALLPRARESCDPFAELALVHHVGQPHAIRETVRGRVHRAGDDRDAVPRRDARQLLGARRRQPHPEREPARGSRPRPLGQALAQQPGEGLEAPPRLAPPHAGHLLSPLEETRREDLAQQRAAQVGRHLEPRQPRDERPRAAHPADAQAAPEELAQGAHREDGRARREGAIGGGGSAPNVSSARLSSSRTATPIASASAATSRRASSGISEPVGL